MPGEALPVTRIASVVALGWIVNRHLVIGTDLRLFMPSPRTPEERLILDEIGDGSGSRMLLLAISGPDPRAAADTSRALAAALRSNGEFRLVANGESGLDAIPDSLLAYRYLLSPTLDHSAWMQSSFEHSSRSAYVISHLQQQDS